ncbi:hypothetical protein QZH41_009652 [Actinostola sp. cb2023]|nr:hypothetical protein QZH41_009652 [Actinostola sp. cb2023]
MMMAMCYCQVLPSLNKVDYYYYYYADVDGDGDGNDDAGGAGDGGDDSDDSDGGHVLVMLDHHITPYFSFTLISMAILNLILKPLFCICIFMEFRNRGGEVDTKWAGN